MKINPYQFLIPIGIVLALAAFSSTGAATDEASAAFVVAAADDTPKPNVPVRQTVKPQGPVQIAYKIIGTPIVGQPVAIDLEVTSTVDTQAGDLSYRINDTTAMEFPETQAARVSLAPTGSEAPNHQQIRVIPMREGRVYLNVSARVETENGLLSTVTAIPIQVGTGPTRTIEDHGTVTTDENGESIRVLEPN